MTRFIPLSIVLTTLVISLLIISDTRLVGRADLPIDDGLFLRLAADLRMGDWLGDYDDLTLAKGPGYPMLIAVANALSIPLKTAEQLLYLLSAGLMSWVVSRLSGRALLGAGLFALLALDPTWFVDGHLRVLRETVYAAASMLVVAGTAWLFLVRAEDQSRIRLLDVAAWMLLGVAAAFFWLVREEGIWLIPTVAFLALTGLLRAMLGRRATDSTDIAQVPPIAGQTSRPRALARLVLGLLVVSISISAVVGAVVVLNARNYGVSLTNDFHDGAFPRALGALSRIQTGPRERYVPISTESRLAAYEVSPAAAELRESLESSLVDWGRIGCQAGEGSIFLRARGEVISCNEYYYGWFPWAVRIAARRAGHWGSATEAQAFLDRLAAEVNRACDDERLTCSAPNESLQPKVGLQHVLDAIALVPDGLRIIAESPEAHGVSASIGRNQDLEDIARLTHSTIAPPQAMVGDGLDAVRITGWVASGRGTPSLQVSPAGDGTVVSHLSSVADRSVLEIAELPDSADHSTSGAVSFTLETNCLADECLLVIGHGDGLVSNAPVNILGPNRLELADDVVLRIFEASPIVNPAERTLRTVAVPGDETTIDVQRQLDGLYAKLVPLLALLGSLGIIAGLCHPSVRRRDWALIVLAVACVIAILSRVGLVALLEVSAWPGALRIAYLAPAAPFMLTFAVVGVYLLIEVIGQLIAARSPSKRDW